MQAPRIFLLNACSTHRMLCIREQLQCMSGALALQLYLSKKNVSHSRAVLRYVHGLHVYMDVLRRMSIYKCMPCSFQVMLVSTHKWHIGKKL